MAKKLVAFVMGKRGLLLAISVVAAIASAKTTGHHAKPFSFFDG